MKKLSLLRHAKAQHDSPSGRDFDRALAERGQNDAERIGLEIRERGLEYDLILTSPAARAVETAQRAGLTSACSEERIYDASPGELLAIAQGTVDEVQSLLMVGHNPGFERLASLLVGSSVDMPTGSLLEMELACDSWKDIGTNGARPVLFMRPKELSNR